MEHSQRRDQRGQTLVEFALGAILLFTLVFSIVEAGRLIYAFSVVHNAAREGARYAAVQPTDGAGVVTAVERLAVGVPISGVEYSPPDPGDTWVAVRVSHEFDVIVPMIAAFFPEDSFTISSTARQYREVLKGVSE